MSEKHPRLKQTLRDVNRMKRTYELIAVIGGAMIGIGIVIFIFFPLSAMQSGMIFLMPLFVLGGGLIMGFSKKAFKRATKDFKKSHVGMIVRDVFPAGEFMPDQGFSENETYATRIMKRSDRFFSEDMIVADHENAKLRSADVKLQEVRSSGKSTTVVTTFLGRLHAMTYDRPFPTDMVVCQPSFFGKLRYRDFTKIDTESLDFNDELDVYAADGLGAFKILTPDFMEKIAMFDRHYGDKIAFSFQGHSCYVAINTKEDMFDIRLFRPFDASSLETYEKQLSEIKTMMEILGTAVSDDAFD